MQRTESRARCAIAQFEGKFEAENFKPVPSRLILQCLYFFSKIGYHSQSNLGPYSFNIASGVLYTHKVDYRKHSFNFVQVLCAHSIAVSFFTHDTLKLLPKRCIP